MLLTLRYIKYAFQKMAFELPDVRTNSFVVANPIYPLAIVFMYLKFVNQWGPSIMKSRPAFKVDNLLIIYNIVQILTCAYTFVRVFALTYGFGKYSLLCESVDTSTSPEALEIINLGYLYFVTKILDLFDTVFFIMRKKQSQVTFLHTYHHAIMVMTAWIGFRYLPGGQSAFIAFVNSLVHVVMYTYYLLAALKLKNIDLSKWKKHMTQMQLTQFFLIALNSAALIIHPYCGYPKFIGYLILPQNMFIALLFLDFYIRTYVKQKK